MAYTTINKSTDYFNTKLYTGTGSSHAISGIGHQPDWVWCKVRSAGSGVDHALFDSVRGVQKVIKSNTNEEELTRTDALSAFDSDGFSFNGNNSAVNSSGDGYVAWNWKANGAGSANSAGATASTVSVNTTAGFSIVKWTNSTSNATTIGHGLGVAPQVMLTKTTSSAGHNWHVYHHKLDTTPQGDYLILNNTSSKSTATNIWNDTAPTSTVFSTGNNGALVNNTLIAYCFAEKIGYSKFGSYIGNGSTDGTFVYTGFKPSWILRKCISSGTGEGWVLIDNKRPGYNVTQLGLFPSGNNLEDTAAHNAVDMLSNGFKMKSTDTRTNANNKTYIYMAFGQSLVGSNNVPCTAR